jgi:hypothetical protein
LEGDAVLEAEGFGEAHSVRAEDAEAVCFVQQGEGLVFFGEVDDFGEGAEVAIHAEDGFGDDEDAGVGVFAADGLEEFGEALDVVVGEDAEGGG